MKNCWQQRLNLSRKLLFTDKTTSHPTKQPKNGCQVVGYNNGDESWPAVKRYARRSRV
jgi:hypothetical protein